MAGTQSPELSHSIVMAGKFASKYKHGKRYDASRVNDILPKSLNCVLGRVSFALVNALMPRDEMWGCLFC